MRPLKLCSGTVPRSRCLCLTLVCLEDLEPLRVLVEQQQSAGDGLADEDFATLIFLEGIRAAADDETRLLLRELQGFPDALEWSWGARRAPWANLSVDTSAQSLPFSLNDSRRNSATASAVNLM